MRKEKGLILMLMLVLVSISGFSQRSKTFTGVNSSESYVVTEEMGDFLFTYEKSDKTLYVKSDKHNIDFSNVGLLTLVFDDKSEIKLASSENIRGVNKAMKFPIRNISQEALGVQIKMFKLYDRRSGKIHKIKPKNFYTL
jgi:hypothetical protein